MTGRRDASAAAAAASSAMGPARPAPTDEGATGARMRIVVLGPTWPYRGGIAQHTTELARQLGRRHDLRLVSFRRQYPRWLFPGRTDRDPSVPVAPPEAAYPLDPLLPWTWWPTARLIAAHRPEALLAEWWVPYFAPSLLGVLTLARRARPGLRVVLECHNVLPHEGRSAPARWLTRAALSTADAFVVHSTADRDALEGLRPGAAARTFLSPLVAAPLPPAPPRGVARERLGLPPDGPLILFFGFVRPYKGLPHLLSALPAVRERLPLARLLVAGEFWEPVAAYERQARSLGVAEAVRFDDGYIPDERVADYFAAADVVALPYVEASQSAVVPLARRFGVPVVASRVGGLPDAVEDGVSGLLVPPADPLALAAALVRCLSDPALARSLAQRAALREDAGWDEAVRAFEAAAAPPRRAGRAVVAG
jgi:glycosyltransferase involved in cell wall biosynthesis